MANLSQPTHLLYPLDATQVEALDHMLNELYQQSGARSAISTSIFSQGGLGPPGIDGLDGESGESGPPGITGAAGAVGAQGLMGMDGEDGEDGVMGPPGIAGATGATGATGADGPAGSASTSGSFFVGATDEDLLEPISMTGNPMIPRRSTDLDNSANIALLNAANTFTATGNNFDEILAVDKGLQFPATQVANTGANVLDDYEEGTWTPGIGGSGGESGQLYSLRDGAYTKIGSFVAVYFQVALSTLGTITGSVQLTGLPFTILNQVDVFPAGPTRWQNMTTALVATLLQGNTNTARAFILGASGAATSLGVLVEADLGNSSTFIGSLCYRATA